MPPERLLATKIGACKAKLAKNNYINLDADERRAIGLQPGDKVRVRLMRTDTKGPIGPRDQYTYSKKVEKSGQVYVPKEARDRLNLEHGDILQYVVVPVKHFPGVENGPVREKIDEKKRDRERGERESSTETFSDKKMQKTGQITIPAEVRDDMALLKNDDVMVKIEHEGNREMENLEVGTGGRITIPKSTREELNLEPGDKPKITVSVFD